MYTYNTLYTFLLKLHYKRFKNKNWMSPPAKKILIINFAYENYIVTIVFYRIFPAFNYYREHEH